MRSHAKRNFRLTCRSTPRNVGSPLKERASFRLAGAPKRVSDCPTYPSVVNEPDDSVWLPLRSIASTSQL